MNFRITFIPDQNYYKEAYSEIVSTLKLKKYQPFFSILLIIIGISLFFYDKAKVFGFMSFLFCLFGIYELYKSYYEKKKWFKDRFNSKIINQQIEIEFTEETFKQSSPFSSGEIKWIGLKDIVKTKKGILIKPVNGISIYISDSVFINEEQIRFVISRKNKTF